MTSLFPSLPRQYVDWLRAEIQPKEKGFKSGEFWPPKLFLSSTQTAEVVGALLAEIDRLRQGLWDVAAETGMDTDGDETPDHMVYPDIVELALREVKQLRQDYETVEGNAWPRG